MNRKNNIVYSISRGFWSIILLILFLVILLSVSISWSIYQSHIQSKLAALPREVDKIEYVFIDSIKYVENYAEFIGLRIADHGADDLNYISSLLGGRANATPNNQNLFITTLFDWVTPEKEMWVSSDRGVFKEPLDMSNREYLERTEKHPWTLQLQGPAIGVPSGQWIIPGGMGITNKKTGKYLGAVTLGFAIDGLARKINAALGNTENQFVILNKDIQYIGGTFGGNQTDDRFFFTRYLRNKGYNLEKNSGFFKEPIEFGDGIYHYYKRTKKHGFIILSGYNKKALSLTANTVLIPRLIELLVVVFSLILFMFLLKRRIVKPLIELSAAVDNISRGEKVSCVPRSSILELRNISKHLINVMRYVNRENLRKKKLKLMKLEAEHAVSIALEAKIAKEEFLRKLRHELKVPLTSILGFAEIIIQQRMGIILPEYVEIAKSIHKSGLQLGTLMTNVLNKKLIAPSAVIKECISIHKDRAYFGKVEYINEIPDNLPEIFVDEVRFRQIITGIIYHSLTLTPENEKISITAHTHIQKNSPNQLIIIVSDTGFGANESFRKKSIDGAGPQGISRNSDGTDLTIDNIQTLVLLHQGSLKIEGKKNHGTTFTITIPYLGIDDDAPYLNERHSNVTPLFKKD